MKKIKNNTELTLTLLGQTIFPGEYYTLFKTEELNYFQDETIRNLVENNTIILNIDDDDLSIPEAMNFLDGETIYSESIAEAIKCSNYPKDDNPFATMNDITNSESGYFTLEVFQTSKAKNKWLNKSSIYSSDVPLIIPCNCKLTGLSFCNKYSYVDLDLEFYKNGIYYDDKVFTWEVRNKQYYAEQGLSVNFDFGDRLYIYCRDKGYDPDDVHIILFFKMISLGSGTLGESWI